MANIILQASEKKSKNVYNNGDWDTRFDEPISIEEGDQVFIDKVFIDNTVANVDHMKIKDDLTLKIVSMIYTQDWLTDAAQYRSQIITDSTYPNCKPFILAEQSAGPVNGKMLTNVMLEPIDRTQHWGGFTFNLKYYLPGTTTYGEKQIKIPRYITTKTVQTFPINIVIDVNISPNNPTTDASTIQLMKLNNTQINSYDYGDPVTSTFLSPVQYTNTIVIKAGDYDPINLATEITTKLSINNATGSVKFDDFLESPYLKLSGQVIGNDIEYSKWFVGEDANMIIRRKNVNNEYYVFGSNQMALVWDPDTMRMKFEYVHMPYYDTTGNISINYIQVVKPVPNPDQLYTAITGVGGVLFSHLSATDTKGNSVDFWEGVLGFDLSTLLTTFTHDTAPRIYTDVITAATTTTLIGFKTSLTKSLNYTQNTLDIDGAIDKKNFTMKAPSLNNYIVESSNTTQIIGDRVYNETDPYGYYLIELDGKYSSNLISEGTSSHKIQGIVSKYNTLASYTSGSSEVAISYIHRSKVPIYMDSCRVRILNSDGTLAENVGPDNTVFIRVQKAK